MSALSMRTTFALGKNVLLEKKKSSFEKVPVEIIPIFQLNLGLHTIKMNMLKGLFIMGIIKLCD